MKSTSSGLNKRQLFQISVLGVTILSLVFLAGCTSVGHEERSEPLISKSVQDVSEFGFDGDDNSLSIAVETVLNEWNIPYSIFSSPEVTERIGNREYTYNQVQTRYVIFVESVDLDTCVPEGSRQMHFNITVMDFVTRKKVFMAKGQFGCLNTILEEFKVWLGSKVEFEAEQPKRDDQPKSVNI